MLAVYRFAGTGEDWAAKVVGLQGFMTSFRRRKVAVTDIGKL